MSRIILCGAKSVGKTTLAQDWCSKHRAYVQIPQVETSEKIELEIPRDKLLQIFQDLNKREKELGDHFYISELGPDLLVETFLEREGEVDSLCEENEVKECLSRFKRCLVVVICPLENTLDGIELIEFIERQNRLTVGIHELLRKLRIPYMYLNEGDREKRLEILKLAARDGIMPVAFEDFITQGRLSFYLDCKRLRETTYSSHYLPLPSQSKEARVRTFELNPCDIRLTYPAMDRNQTNRMVDRYGEENFILLQFHEKLPAELIITLLLEGVYVNGEEYQFLGCSVGGLKDRKCYLLRGTVGYVDFVLERCGDFSDCNLVSKLLKRIGMLFSVAIKTNVKIFEVEEIPDIIVQGNNFSDGCGFIGLRLAEKLAKCCNVKIDSPEDGIPTVFQIRIHGCKGIVIKDPNVNEDSLQVRKSMNKFLPGKEPFPEVWVCDYSRPYTYGRLNKQFVILLSGLDIPDQVFLDKQEDYFKGLENMLVDPESAIVMLNWCDCPDLAAKIARCRSSEEFQKREIQHVLKFQRSKLINKLEKISIPILNSRTLFGVCDPSSMLEYGQCFVRISINGHPMSLEPGTRVVVGKNPCYLLGDIRILIAVDYPQLHHLVDCIVFPVKGKRPHSEEIAGSDLDGDQYFVCWDKDLIPPRPADPYDYPSVEAEKPPELTRDMKIEYFSKYKKTMGKINAYFLFWAEKHGPGCYECEELGRFFSRSVDASKTGDIVRIRRELIPPKVDPNNSPSDKVWIKMENIAKDCKQKLSGEIVNAILADFPNTFNVTEEFIRNLMASTDRNISEYKMFDLLCMWYRQWSEREESSASETKEKLIELSDYINFGVLTYKERIKAIRMGIPTTKVLNALNKSRLLTKEMLQSFYLDIPACGWKFFTRESTLTFDWNFLIRALKMHSETLLILQLEEKRLAFHLLGPFKEGESIIPAGCLISYFFSPSFKYRLRYVTGCQYNLYLTEGVIQIYREHRDNTFVKLSLNSQNSQGIECCRISIDLVRFKNTILTIDNHPIINKQKFQTVEIFVKSDHIEEIAYLDIHESNQIESLSTAVETIDELPSEDEDTDISAPIDYIPFDHDTSLIALEQFAKNGDYVNFSRVIALIPEPTHEIPEPFSHFKLTENILSLLANFVVRSSHRKTTCFIIESISTIIYSPHLIITSTKDLLGMYTSLSKLQCFDLISHHLDWSIDKLSLSTMAEYFECVSNWEWWCFLPATVAYRLLDRLYILSRKLDSVRNPGTTLDPGDLSLAMPADIKALAQAADDTATPPLDQVQLNEYKRYYSYLMLKYFLEESPNQEEYSKVSDTEHSVCKLRVRSDDKQENAKAEVSSEEETGDIPDEKKSKKKKQCKIWRARFSRNDKITKSKFLNGLYVKIRLVNGPNSTHSNEPIALGSISTVSSNSAVTQTSVSVDFLEPVPECLKRSARLRKGYWYLSLVGNVTSFKRASKALQNINSPGIISILISSEAFPPKVETENTQLYFSAKSPEIVQLPDKNEPIINPYRPFDNCKACELTASTRFNRSQENAITAALHQRLTLIHGPPGTGKTFVACEIVHQLCHRIECNVGDENKMKILVTAETNYAVDNLTYNLKLKMLKVVRMGKKSEIDKKLHDVALEHQVDMKQRELSNDNRREFQSTKLKREIIDSVDIVAATCTGAGDTVLKGIKFFAVLIDEATQVIEPISLIPIAKSCAKLILVGDPKQLDPTLPKKTVSKQHTRSNEVPPFEALRVTLFHRLHRQMEARFLDEQHRMHPYIADYPSRVFYNGMLKTAVRKEDRVPPNVRFLTPEKPVVFINVSTAERHTGSSFKNEGEANVVVDIVNHLTSLTKYTFEEIGVLTPYSGQVKCIREKLERVDVSSIDGFQGKEKEIIIFSTVRNNENGLLGFTDSAYRINVLMTRARSALIGVGDRDILRNSEIWSDWMWKMQEQQRFYTETEFYKLLQNNEEIQQDEDNYRAERRRRTRDEHSFNRGQRTTPNRRPPTIGSFAGSSRGTRGNRNYRGRSGPSDTYHDAYLS